MFTRAKFKIADIEIMNHSITLFTKWNGACVRVDVDVGAAECVSDTHREGGGGRETERERHGDREVDRETDKEEREAFRDR